VSNRNRAAKNEDDSYMAAASANTPTKWVKNLERTSGL
jgi:hypothetical protein